MLRKLSGDTLIEVMFATGIFSMVAISVVALMNNSTSKIQAALESTMARNEIDAEAEALRFIQSSYVSEINAHVKDSAYKDLWYAIKNEAVTDASVTDFSPKTCGELYADNGEAKKYGFVINYHNLYTTGSNSISSSGILYDGKTSPALFKEAPLYPRLMFNNQDKMYSGTSLAKNMTAAEGIYVVAVKDIDKTNVVEVGGVKKAAAFFDFYIRSCWMAPGSDVPTVVSTVIRLYDPEV